LARIGRSYATEFMLVWSDTTGQYDSDAATLEFGIETLAKTTCGLRPKTSLMTEESMRSFDVSL